VDILGLASQALVDILALQEVPVFLVTLARMELLA
jgi:hypothetical protein